MLAKALEFVRMIDLQPTDEKVRNRKQAASELQAELEASRETFLDFVQGVVAGFNRPAFTQESTSVKSLIKAIQNADTTVPHDLSENAAELRVTSALAIGEYLSSFVGKAPDGTASCGALALHSALQVRPPETEQHLRFVHEALFNLSAEINQTAAIVKRTRSSNALKQLATLEEATPATDLWSVVVPSLRAVLREVEINASMDREELEALWWMFGGYSNIAKSQLGQLNPHEGAFCAAIELAQRVLLPPPSTVEQMVGRAVETGRKASALAPTALQDVVQKWSKSALRALVPPAAEGDAAILRYPVLLPITWACRRLLDLGEGQTLGKEFELATGLPLIHALTPSQWGAQIFSEKCLQRMLGIA